MTLLWGRVPAARRDSPARGTRPLQGTGTKGTAPGRTPRVAAPGSVSTEPPPGRSGRGVPAAGVWGARGGAGAAPSHRVPSRAALGRSLERFPSVTPPRTGCIPYKDICVSGFPSPAVPLGEGGESPEPLHPPRPAPAAPPPRHAFSTLQFSCFPRSAAERGGGGTWRAGRGGRGQSGSPRGRAWCVPRDVGDSRGGRV